MLLALWFFTTRDDATTSAPAAAAPGQPFRAPAAFAADLRRGNVVIAVDDRRERAAAQRLARDIAGPPDPALRAAGQAVLVEATPPEEHGNAAPPYRLAAYAPARRLTADRADDPALRDFVEYWLGRAAG